MPKYLYGKQVSEEIKAKIKNNLDILNKNNIKPIIATIRFDDTQDDILYENSIIKNFNEMGINVKKYKFDKDFKNNKKIFIRLNESKNINAIIVLGKIPEKYLFIKKEINPIKDVDSIGEKNHFDIYNTGKPVNYPCTPYACIEVLKYYNITIKSKNIVIIGRSKIVGLPLSLMLLHMDATITICHSKSKNLKNIIKDKDIIILCAGFPGLIKSSYLSKNQIVIDVSTNFLNGKLCGDLKIDKDLDDSIYIAPVPGGIGKVTTSILAMQTVKATMFQNQINFE